MMPQVEPTEFVSDIDVVDLVSSGLTKSNYNMSVNLFSYRRIMPLKSLVKQRCGATTNLHAMSCDVFIINFVVDIVFTVIRHILLAT